MEPNENKKTGKIRKTWYIKKGAKKQTFPTRD